MYKIVLIFMFVVSLNAQLVDGVAIVVKGKAITLYDIKKEMSLSKVDEKKATDSLIRKKLEEIETIDRRITITSAEVYDDIKKTAERNNMNVSEFYEAVRDANGISSSDLKVKVKERLLSQKLYSAISYTAMSQPSEDEITEYYDLHKDEFLHPSAFDVVIYQSKEKSRVQEKVDNPMFYSPEITMHEQTLPYDRISPELAGLLTRTSKNNFTAVVPDGKGGYMSFYVKDVKSASEGSVDDAKNQIINKLMADAREQVLSDYFARLRHNADIKMIRSVQ